MIIQTMRLLILDGGNLSFNMFTALKLTCLFTNDASAYRDQVLMSSDIIQLSLMYINGSVEKAILKHAVTLVMLREIGPRSIGPRYQNCDPYDDMMDRLSCIYANLFLVCPDVIDEKTKDIVDRHDIESFIYIAGYSSQPVRSKKLACTILSSLTATSVNRLKSAISKCPGGII